MLVMALATAAPAMAQTATDDSVALDNSNSVVYESGSQNVIGSIETGDAMQGGDATATATDGSVAVATIDADLDASVDVYNSLGNFYFYLYY